MCAVFCRFCTFYDEHLSNIERKIFLLVNKTDRNYVFRELQFCSSYDMKHETKLVLPKHLYWYDA